MEGEKKAEGMKGRKVLLKDSHKQGVLIYEHILLDCSKYHMCIDVCVLCSICVHSIVHGL